MSQTTFFFSKKCQGLNSDPLSPHTLTHTPRAGWRGKRVHSSDMYESTMCPCMFLRSNDSDDTTKRKVNLVFEKIQTLKSRATGSVQADNRVSRCYTAVIGLRTRQNYELLITGCPLTEAFYLTACIYPARTAIMANV